jgi:hypothetical protein
MGDDTTRTNSRAGSARDLIWLNPLPFRTSTGNGSPLPQQVSSPAALNDRCMPFEAQPLCPCTEARPSPDLSGAREWPVSGKFGLGSDRQKLAELGRRLPVGAGAAMRPFADMRSLSIVCFRRTLGTVAPGHNRS